MRVEEHRITLDGQPVYYLAARSPQIPTLYLHSAPTSSDDWISALEHTGGVAPDLIGFGRSAKGGHLDYSLPGHATFVAGLLSHLALKRINLVGHGWGAAVAALLAARNWASVHRLVLIDPAPPLRPDSWHRWARIWRTPLVGELAMGSTGRMLLRRMLRSASANPEAWPEWRVGQVWEQFDQGTQRAVLRMHRSIDSEVRDEIETALGTLTIPSLLLWGDCDSWFPPALAGDWLARLPQATEQRIDRAGHWPWLEKPDVLELIAAFLAQG